jgi:CelD/BcsL family acetyltransferase involved in cellulose biosynthesis
MLASQLITDPSGLSAMEDAWDELAVANRLPLMAPACVMAWWRHMAPPSAQLRALAVYDGEALIGLAPFYADLDKPRKRVDYRLPGIQLAARLAPLALPGRERDVATAIARELGACTPRPDLIALEGAPLSSDWAEPLRASWPRRPRPAIWRYEAQGCPTVSLGADSFDAWLAAKSSNFRSQMRRLRRQFDAAGGTVRLSTPETLRSDVDAFMHLHSSRWQDRGRSSFVALGERMPAMLEDLGGALLRRDGRFRLHIFEIDGEPISAQLFLDAGGHVLYVNGGWDERFAQLKPAMLTILLAIEEAFSRGDGCVDLGTVEQPYKQRFADGDAPVTWTIVMPVRPRAALTWLSVAPMVGRSSLRNTILRRMSVTQVNRARKLRARISRKSD